MTHEPLAPAFLSRLVQTAMLALVAGYRHAVSPLLPMSCRYQPSCSAYAEEAIRRFGPWRGGRLALARLLRCHPWGGYGFDPVPDGPRQADGRTSDK